jgi:lysine 6-dehydrogenase
MQGRACAHDLVRSPGVSEVLIIDQAEERARAVAAAIEAAGRPQVQVRSRCLDVASSRSVADAVSGFGVVISAAPYFLNPGIALACLKAGASMVDMGGNTDVVREELALDDEARRAGVTIIPDCGLAPGLSNVLVAHGVASLDEVDTVKVRVAGLPQRPRPPLNYKLVFSPYGLINEYVGQATILKDGRRVQVPALSDVEEIVFPEPPGVCEAFHTAGGSSTLPWTFEGKVRHLDYKTVRYPGHAAQIRLVRDMGFFDETPLDVLGTPVKPRDLTAALFAGRLDLPDVPDLVVARVVVTGTVSGKPARRSYEMIDYPDRTGGITAMMRTTAYPTSVIAQMIARKETEGPGALPVEKAVPAGLLLTELEKRGIRVTQERS